MSPRTAEHESGHATAALLLGHHIDGIEMHPERGVRARSLIPMEPESVTLEHIVIVLAGGMASTQADGTGHDTWPPPWPIPRTKRSSDLLKLGALCRWLRVDEATYRRTVELTRELIDSHEFRRLSRTIAALLDIADEIDGEELRRVHRSFEQLDEETHRDLQTTTQA